MGRRIWAIFRKEAQDIVTNFNVSFIYIVAIGIVVLFQRTIGGVGDHFITGFGILFLLAMGGIYVPSMLIAEEREKRTLAVLMLSPASPIEIFVGKGLLTLVSMVLTALAIYLLQGVALGRIPALLFLFVLGVCSCIPLGMVVGMVAPNILSTGLVGMPLYMSLTFLPMFAERGTIVKRLSRWVPTTHVYDATMLLLEGRTSGASVAEAAAALLGIFAAACGLLAYAYRKRAAALT